MRGADEHLFHKVLFLGFVSRYTLAAAVLCAVFGNGKALDVARMRHGNDNLLYGNKVCVLYIAAEIDGNFRTSFGGVFALDFKQIVFDNFKHSALVCEYVLKVCNLRFQSRKLVSELIDLEVGYSEKP